MSVTAPVRKAVIPAAGLGTRFLPATKAQPKEMLPIIDIPTIQYVVEEAVASGIEDILIITGRDKRAIEDHFDYSVELENVLARRGKTEMVEELRAISEMAQIHYVRQKEPLGLGHAVFCARQHVGGEPFAVLLGDDIIRGERPCLRQMLDVYEETGSPVVAVLPVPAQATGSYGIVDPDPSASPADGRRHRVRDLVEKPDPEEAPSNLAVIGRYVLPPEIFAILERQTPGVGGEIQLTDALRTLNRSHPIIAYAFEGNRYDVGDRLGFLQATVEFALGRPDVGPAFRAYLESLLREQA